MAEKVGIKEIAKAAGVSSATVSRALSAKGLVAEPKLSRIREVAKAMNYRPNVQARSLRTRRSMSVLVVVRDISNPFYLEVFKGVEATARNAQYSVLMGNTEGDPIREIEYFDMLCDGHADGLILMTGKLPENYDDDIENVVVALEMVAGSALAHVTIDNALSAEVAVEHLVSLGHRRIAHVSGPDGEGMSEERKRGFLNAMAKAGLQVPDAYNQVGDYHFRSGLAIAPNLLDLQSPPTAIFASNDEMAFGIMRAAQERGLEIPRDLSVIGFDDIYLSEAVFPPLTTISQPRVAIGNRAMESLLQKIDGNEPVTNHVLPTKLVVRATTAAPRLP